MINPDFLTTLVQLSKTRNFTQTARALNMTQPGVSQHIRRLEEHFGAELVERGESRPTLTHAGWRLVEFAQKYSGEHNRLREEIQNESPYAGRVRMSSPGSWGLLIFDVMLRCAQKHPQLRTDLTTSPSSDIPRRVLADEIDVGYATVPSGDPKIHCEEFHRDALVIVLPKGQRPKTLEDYKRIGLVWHPDMPHLATRVFSKSFAEYQGIEEFPVRVSINQMNRVIDAIDAGLGFCILPRISVHYYRKGKNISSVTFKDCEEEQLYRLTLKGRKLPQRVQYLENEIRKTLRKFDCKGYEGAT
jgi:DNA-binding transcriptional LysR family regulator